MQARFWEWINGGWVCIKINPGQELNWATGGPCDEGYHIEYHNWEYDEDCIIRRYSSVGRDCDGPHEYHYDATVRIDRLEAVEHDGIVTPEWVEADSWQRDVFAEQMGY